MSDHDLRAKLRSEIQAVDSAALVPHHHRGALFILDASVDLLELAIAIASDHASAVSDRISDGTLKRSEAGQLADWCLDLDLRFQFVILQPYVLAQVLPPIPSSSGSA